MEPNVEREPSLAELARTCLAKAEFATVISCAGPGADALAVVKVKDASGGRPLVELDRSSAMVRRLAVCPVATVSVAAQTPFTALYLTGPATPCRPTARGMRTYRVSLLSARLVAGTSVPVPLGAFHAAEPDPLWRYSSQTVAHLGEAHAAELLACVRAHGSPEAQQSFPGR